MGLSFRKSIKVGPFRLSASKSGMNVSAGLRGLRVGAGPRGSYVSASTMGITVRQSLGSSPRSAVKRSLPQQNAVTAGGALKEIASVEAGSLRDSSSASLLAEIAAARRSVHVFPLLLLGWIVGIVTCIGMGLHPLLLAVLIAFGIWTSVKAYERDAVRCLVPIFFQLEEPYLGAFEGLVAALEAMRSVASLWHIDAQGSVRDPKYHAGAGKLVQRQKIQIVFGQPPSIRTNLDIPQLMLGRKRLTFFPDRVLIFEGSSVGALSYSDLGVTVLPSRFIEEGAVPPDARLVGTTWKYVNKQGGPDKRFKNNRQLPVLLYERIQLQSLSGLYEILEASRLGTGQRLVAIVQRFREIAEPPELAPAPDV
jgi:hypothetical protein